MFKRKLLLAAGLTVLASAAAAQEIKIGLTGSFTGPTAAVGQPYKNAAEIFPATLGGAPVKWIVLDDGGDPTAAVKNARKFIDEEKVDAILGSTAVPAAMAMFDAAVQGQTLQISMSPVPLAADKRPWVFVVPQPTPIMVSAIVADMKKRGVKTVGYIGFTDGWGDQNAAALKALAGPAGITVTGDERYNRTDTSATAQALKIMAGNPQAVFIGGSATPATLPHLALVDQGFKGQVYHSHGSVSRPVLEAGGKAIEGALAPTGPIAAAAELPDSNPVKKVALDFIDKYEAKWGKGSRNPFAGYAWDGMLLLNAAVPDALKKAKPGTAEFRTALRDSLQSGREVIGTHGVYKYTVEDHYGVDERARVLVIVKDGAFRYFP